MFSPYSRRQSRHNSIIFSPQSRHQASHFRSTAETNASESPRKPGRRIQSVKTAWRATLKRASVPVPHWRLIGRLRLEKPTTLILRPISKLANLLPPNSAAWYLQLDILFFPFGRQRTSPFMRDVLEPVQSAIASRWSRVRQVSGETGDRSRIFQFPPHCGQHAVSGEITRRTLENRDQIRHSTGISNRLQSPRHCRFR